MCCQLGVWKGWGKLCSLTPESKAPHPIRSITIPSGGRAEDRHVCDGEVLALGPHIPRPSHIPGPSHTPGLGLWAAGERWVCSGALGSHTRTRHGNRA